MGDLFGLLVIAGALCWFYKAGKRTGSRKGYGVGRNHGQREGR